MRFAKRFLTWIISGESVVIRAYLSLENQSARNLTHLIHLKHILSTNPNQNECFLRKIYFFLQRYDIINNIKKKETLSTSLKISRFPGDFAKYKPLLFGGNYTLSTLTGLFLKKARSVVSSEKSGIGHNL